MQAAEDAGRGARLIVGNLDCEVAYAVATPEAPGDARAASHCGLPRRVLDRISAQATFLRVFAREGDILWTPRAVARRRIPEVPGLPVPSLATGPLEELPLPAPVLAWGETPATEALRGRIPEPAPLGAAAAGESLAARLWGIRPARAGVARSVNDRAFALETAERLGCSLPCARTFGEIAELERHLARGAWRHGSDGRWVAKAVFSAAGRARLIARGPRLSGPEARRLERLLSVHGRLLFEPWLARTRDFGTSVLVSDGRIEVLGVHVLEVDSAGRFRGIALPPDRPERDGTWPIAPRERDRLEDVAAAAARAAAAAGYRGPLGIDAWQYRSEAGELLLHPLGEMNARATFGLVARALRDRLRPRFPDAVRRGVRLRFGERLPPAGSEHVALLAGEPGEGAAWLEIGGAEDAAG